jgi:hypothetical protein
VLFVTNPYDHLKRSQKTRSNNCMKLQNRHRHLWQQHRSDKNGILIAIEIRHLFINQAIWFGLIYETSEPPGFQKSLTELTANIGSLRRSAHTLTSLTSLAKYILYSTSIYLNQIRQTFAPHKSKIIPAQDLY